MLQELYHFPRADRSARCLGHLQTLCTRRSPSQSPVQLHNVMVQQNWITQHSKNSCFFVKTGEKNKSLRFLDPGTAILIKGGKGGILISYNLSFIATQNILTLRGLWSQICNRTGWTLFKLISSTNLLLPWPIL